MATNNRTDFITRHSAYAKCVQKFFKEISSIGFYSAVVCTPPDGVASVVHTNFGGESNEDYLILARNVGAKGLVSKINFFVACFISFIEH